MTSLPYLQLYTSDYLADTAHLTTEEHGAYLLLIMNYWQRGKPLDNTDNRLAHVARLTDERWKAVETVLSQFFQIDGQIWFHSRIERDLAAVREKSDRASYAGKRSAVQRSLNERSTFVQRSFNQEEEEEDEKEDNKNTLDHKFDLFWTAYPRHTAKGAARKAFAVALKKTTAEKLIAAAECFKNDPNREEAFTAHASTWLNQERWLDDPLPQKQAPASLRGLITTPTLVPPQFTSEDVPKGSPMPESLRKLFGVSQTTS